MNISKPPTRKQLMELLALPHGEANKVLKKHKMWNESKDPSSFPFDVVIAGYIDGNDDDAFEYNDVSGKAVVYAIDLAAARDLAERLESDDIQWDISVSVECDMMDDWVIVSVADVIYE